MAGWVRRIPWRYVLSVLVLCGIIAPLIPAVRAARQAAWRAQRCNDLKQVGLALHNYADAQRTLPPVVIRDAQGRLTTSWRLRIYPFVEASGLYAYAANKRWSDTNAFALLLHPPYVFCDPGGEYPKSFSETSIVAVAGPGTAFDDGHCLSIADLSPNTILAVELRHSGIYWAEPRDLDVSEIPDSITSGFDGDGVHVLFADGTVWYLRKEVPLDDLKKFFTVEGAKHFDREQVLGPYARR